jgi:hypothetical protein
MEKDARIKLPDGEVDLFTLPKKLSDLRSFYGASACLKDEHGRIQMDPGFELKETTYTLRYPGPIGT